MKIQNEKEHTRLVRLAYCMYKVYGHSRGRNRIISDRIILHST